MYVYEHLNGTVHEKPDLVVETGGGPDDYFNSPFVRRWWHENDCDLPCYKTGQFGAGCRCDKTAPLTVGTYS